MQAIKSHKLGEYELFFLRDGAFSLDAGCLFGVLPKVLWSRFVTPDEKNRTELPVRPMLVKTPDKNILVDPGLGDKWTDKQRAIWKVHFTDGTVFQGLEACGLKPEDIDMVILSHMHFDHAGACTIKEADGTVRPAFPNARHIVQKGEWEAAVNPDERGKSTYFPDNYMPLEEAGLIDIIDGDVEICPGIRSVITGGHTKDHMMIVFESGGKIAAWPGGILPTVRHLPVAWGMSFDLYPVETMEQRKKWYPIWIKEQWLLAVEHDPQHPAGYLKEGEKAPEFIPI